MRSAPVRLALSAVGAAATIVAALSVGPDLSLRPSAEPWSAAEVWHAPVAAGPVAVAVLRLVVLVGSGWLLVASVLQLVASVAPRGGIRTIADAVSPWILRRMAHGVAGLTVTVTLVSPPSSEDLDPSGTAVMEVLEAPEPPTTASPTTVPTPPPRPSLPPASAPGAVPAPPARRTPGDTEVVVAVGDSFWSLAVDAVADRPSGASVDRYWRRLMDANRTRLVDPDNPDLLYPGQVLELPPLEG